MQNKLNGIEDWTNANLMQINEIKSNYIIYSRSKQEFATRLSINGVPLERLTVIKLLGIWLDEDLSWETNTKQITIKAFTRLQMLTKLKYAGIKRDHLLDIYKLFIRSVVEYCSVVFHTSLTQKQSKKLENIQSTCLKIILGDDYIDYETALASCSLSTLYDRRCERMNKFAVRCVKDKFNKQLFPLNENPKKREAFRVNFARTSKYQKSAVPQCQRMLNNIVKANPDFLHKK